MTTEAILADKSQPQPITLLRMASPPSQPPPPAWLTRLCIGWLDSSPRK